MSKDYFVSLHDRPSLDWRVYHRLSQNGKQISTLFRLPEEIGSLSHKALRHRSADPLRRGGVEEADAPQKQAGGEEMRTVVPLPSRGLAFVTLFPPRTSGPLGGFPCFHHRGHTGFCRQQCLQHLCWALCCFDVLIIHNDFLNQCLKIVLSSITGSDRFSAFPFLLHLKGRRLLPTLIFYILTE